MDQNDLPTATSPKSNLTPSSVVGFDQSTTTSAAAAEPFDPAKFQPEFQGGFKPIYPTGGTTPKTAVETTKAIDAKSTSSDDDAAEDSIESLISDFLNGDDPESSTTSN